MTQWKFVEWLLVWLLTKKIFIFEWDNGNTEKNYLKHKVSTEEAESVFVNGNLLPLGIDALTISEERFGIIGQSSKKRYLLIVFLIRKNKIRIISARPANKKERVQYEKTTNKIS